MRIHLLSFTSLLVVSGVVQAKQTLKFGDIVRNSDGSVRYMNQYDADSFCAEQGMRLPSARELAQLAASRGAKGIKKLSHFPSDYDAQKADYILVRTQNDDGKFDSFYFNPNGYAIPAKENGKGLFNVYFWSSSINPYNPDKASILYNGHGSLLGCVRDYNFIAVRCVVGS